MIGRMLFEQARMELRLTLRRGEAVLLTLIVPVSLLLFFGATKLFDIELDFLVPGLMTLSVISSGLVALAIATGFERKYMVLKRLGATPLPRWILFAGKLAATLFLEALQLVIILGAARLALDYRPQMVWWALILGVVLGTCAFGGIAFLLSGTLRAEATLAVVNGLFVAFFGLGGVMFAIDNLPRPLAAVADILPASGLSETFRWATGYSASVGHGLWVLMFWAVIAPLLAVRLFSWEEK
jgi:ABC-2 type transport system permease protein